MATDSNTIVGLYVMYYGRSPDPSGLAFWEQQPLSATEIAAEFGKSAEAKQLYPFLAAPTIASPTEFITQVYQNAFGRLPDEGGLAYWTEFLQTNNSPTDIATFILTVAQGATGSDVVALQNRADVALDFTTQAVNGKVTFNQDVAATSNQIIATVTDDPATVTAAKEASTIAIANINSSGGGFTLLSTGAILTSDASINVSPSDKFLSTADNQIKALTFLEGAYIEDSSTSDNDTLTATVITPYDNAPVGGPAIINIENIELTGSLGTGIGSTINLSNITGAKEVSLKSGNLVVQGTDNQALTLAAGFKNQVDVVTEPNLTSKLILDGTVAGTKIFLTDFPGDEGKSTVSIEVTADSTISSLVDTQGGLIDYQSNIILTGEKNLTLNGTLSLFDSQDGTQYARLDGSDFAGQLSITTNSTSVTTFIDIIGGLSDDTFNFVTFGAGGTLTNETTINGNEGFDTLTVQGTNFDAFNFVTNVEKIVFANSPTGASAAVTTLDRLVAAGQTVEIDASALTGSFLFFDGSAETNGSFNVKGGASYDELTGGGKNDILAGNGATALQNELWGGGGSDQFVMNQTSEVGGSAMQFIYDFTTGAGGDTFGISASVYAGAPAVGSVFETSIVSGAVNASTTVLVQNGLLGTNTSALNQVRFGYDSATSNLYYDADGNFASGSVAIAETFAPLTGLIGSNFVAIA
jgi:hypothetical protein